MRIAAIYIYPNSKPHLFGDDHLGITINLGGKYFYDVSTILGNEIITEKKINKNFIKDFWGINIELVSAIVGANGTGKTTILNLIKESCQLIIEEDTKEPYIMWTSAGGLFFYYSPYLGANNEDGDVSNVHNLSKLSQFKKDTRWVRDEFNVLWEYHNSERLKRIISFLKKEKYVEILNEMNITSFTKIKLRFLIINKDNSNTSRNFRPFFDRFSKLINTERETKEQEVLESLKLDTKNKINESDEYNDFSKNLRLKLYILDSVIHKIHSILERTGNDYLEEGFIKNNISEDDPEFLQITSTKEALFWFLDNAYIEKGENKYYLPKKEIKSFTQLLLDMVDEDNHINYTNELTVDFNNVISIIDSYQRLLLSFRDVFTYDETLFLTFQPDITLSSGEMSFYELFSSLDDANNIIENRLDAGHYDEISEYPVHQNYFILIDEGDLGFHPTWKKSYINSLISVIPEIFQNKTVQIILTTHDPLTLSDIPSHNSVYLDKDDLGKTILYHKNDNSSFGANIHDLLSDNFFLKGGHIGDFAKQKINTVITLLNSLIGKKKKFDKVDILNKEKEILFITINMVGDTIVRKKLLEMYFEVFSDTQALNNEINNLEKQILLLKKKRDDIT
ncbi:hypothetical protein [Cochleicola gelatinilyticus]|uniref:ATPase AAA-type core domain-containing protein n=1 Tax=Cochleicola gelatinilyticus TaxID=1763537 RepID=A0A167KFU6_9FLAO|nr:hypothetical protein [Cochleicola gelatinilyticus]OAB81847.1 hypothetical protein ULVI_00490 [Cochleicola gelatinilyticus]